MPFVSRQQQKWGHTPEGEKALGGPSKVAEWDAATKGKDIPMVKGSAPKEASYAKGGIVLGRTDNWAKQPKSRGFLDTPDEFTGGRKVAGAPASQETDEVWGKGSSKANPKGVDKSEKAIKPRG